MHDLRFAFRSLRKNPGFTLVAILSLALGTGANTAIFSLIDAVMLRMLPVSHPEQLVFVDTNAVQMGSVRVSQSIDVATVAYLSEHATTISGIAGASSSKISVAANGQADRAAGQFVTPGYYSTLGVHPFLGRILEAGDANADGRSAVLSYAYWQRRFGGDPTILGRAITLNTIPFTIVGVTPRDFYGISDDGADVTAPLATLRQVSARKMSSEAQKPDDPAGTIFARLKDGVAASQASAELTPLVRQFLLQHVGEDASRFQVMSKLTIETTPANRGLSQTRSRFSDGLKALMAVVAVVLLIACANLANLLLAKSESRRREIAIRLSLGSTRARLIRQLLTESLVLAAGGGALGFLFAIWARDAIVTVANVPGSALAWDYRVVLFTAGVCLLSALLFGTMPALRATAVDFATALKSAAARQTGGRFMTGRVLVALQVALSFALLTGAALFLRTFHNLNQVDLGYARKDALAVTIDPSLAGYRDTRATQLYQQSLDRIAQLPGVRSVSLMRDRLMTGNLKMNGVSVPGYIPKNGEDPKRIWVITNLVGSHFVTTSGMTLADGRDFTDSDNARSQKVAVVNESMARHFFGSSAGAINRQFFEDPAEPSITIVGVVRNLKYFSVRQNEQDVMFLPAQQASEPMRQATLLIRTAIDPSRLAAPVRAAIAAIDSSVPVYDMITVDDQVLKALSLQRLIALLSAFFAGLALLLAAIGLYGVLSYTVAQRTGEIGIRMAIGAQPGTVLRMILNETARFVFAGLAAGIALALAAARLIKSMLFGVTPADATSLIAACAILLAFALVAAFLPARRASRVDPMVALRHE